MMAFETLALLGIVALAGTASFALLRREEVAPLARPVLAAPPAASALALAVLGFTLPAGEALAQLGATFLVPLGIMTVGILLASFGRPHARLALLLVALSAVAWLAPLFLGTIPREAGPVAFAVAFSAALAVPTGTPWTRASILAWAPTAAWIFVTGLRALLMGDASAWEIAALLSGLAGTVLALVHGRRTPAKIHVFGMAAGAGIGALGLTALDVVALVVLPCAWVAIAFLRGRALGAASRPLAATAAAYAVAIITERLLALERPVAMVLAMLAGASAVIAVEVGAPSLDEARARRRAIERARETPSTAPLTIGTGTRVVGRYHLIEKLGEGSFGTAYVANDEVAGGRVVVKALHATASGDVRLLREARAIAAVRHPRVVALHDVAVERNGAFLVIEYVDGGSLADRLARGPLTRLEFPRVATDVLDALEAVHQAGIIHRDIKPSNVLLTKKGEAKLADFGLARAGNPEATVSADPLAPPAGTLRYMSPEQARGRPATIASDVYAAAATLFEALTGRAYVLWDPNESAVEIQVRIASMPPFERPIEPEPIRAWFARALDPEPEARFSSAREAREALVASLA